MASMESKAFVESPPLIYGLDHECRAMCAQFSDHLPTRFFVGTQSLESEANQVHFLEYSEENSFLSKVVFRHKAGEIWHLISPSKRPQNLITCYSARSNLAKSSTVQNHCAIWSIPIDIDRNLAEYENHSQPELRKLYDFDEIRADESLGKIARLRPEQENEIILMLQTKLVHVDVESKKIISYITTENLANSAKNLNRLSKMSKFCWNPHFSGNLISIFANNNIYAKDLRTSSASTWSISQAHSQVVLDMDFNPNSQFYVASCGDDCEVKFWDIRDTSKPVIQLMHHSHWAWSVRYNSFHDHLVLSVSSDGNVNLLRASSIASQPYGQFIEDEFDEEDSSIKKLLASKPKLNDGLVKTFEDHADSVYAVEWSPNDPWIFASLSYDGRFIINKVPESEKMSLVN